jgi:osmotically-inducible protein OsmY
MRPRFVFALCFAVLAVSVACSQSDQEKARERADDAKEKTRQEAERLRADARKLGHEAQHQAKALGQQINQAVNGGRPASNNAAGQAQEKLEQGSRDLRVEGDKAAVKLDHAAMIAKVRAKLASDVGLSTVTNIDVDATGTVVTLRGTVSSEEQKQQAEQSVGQISGVTKVVNDLRVRP